MKKELIRSLSYFHKKNRVSIVIFHILVKKDENIPSKYQETLFCIRNNKKLNVPVCAYHAKILIFVKIINTRHPSFSSVLQL